MYSSKFLFGAWVLSSQSSGKHKAFSGPDLSQRLRPRPEAFAALARALVWEASSTIAQSEHATEVLALNLPLVSWDFGQVISPVFASFYSAQEFQLYPLQGVYSWKGAGMPQGPRPQEGCCSPWVRTNLPTRLPSL